MDRAAELLSLIVRAEVPPTYTELTQSTGLARSTTSRLLQALERGDMIEKDGNGGYRGGALFAEYASRFDRVESIVSAAGPALDRIADETGETVNLGVPRGNTVVQVAQVDSAYILGTTNWEAVDVPPHLSALGKVMYAFGALSLPAGKLEARTPASVSNREELERQLGQIRDAGYAITRGELEEGLDAVAAPVRGSGVVHAAIGVSGPEFRLGDTHDRVGKLLVEEANRLAKVLAKWPARRAS